MFVFGRVGQNSAQIGIVSPECTNGGIVSLRVALQSIDEVRSIESFTEYHGAFVSICITESTAVESRTHLTFNTDSPMDNLSDFLLMEEGRQYFLSSDSPAGVRSHNYHANVLSTVTKIRIGHNHSVWILFGLKDQGDLDVLLKNRLLNVATSIARPSFDLLKRLCCLSPACNALDLSQGELSGQEKVREDPANEQAQTQKQSLVSAFERLNEFESAIITLMAEGKSNPEIATELFVSPSSVRNTSSNIYNKIGARNRQQAIVLFMAYRSVMQDSTS